MFQRTVIVVRILVLSFLLVAAFGLLGSPNFNGVIIAQESNELVSLPVDTAPTLDGVADEAFWEESQVVEILVERGVNTEETTVTIRSVYTEDSVYFLVTYADPTESFLRAPWELQADGTWLRLSDPEDEGGDNNLWYEDKFAMIWPINNSVPEFEEDGCFTACHRSDDGDDKPYGNKFFEEEGALADMWHWKSIRNDGQIHDQYLDSAEYSPENVNAGRHSDPSESGGYRDNISEDRTMPAFMPAGDLVADGSPGYLLEDELVPFDPSLFETGDRLPSIIRSPFVGDGGDISAGWVWADGFWTLEFGRLLVTESDFDVQFSDLSASYYFGVATFDNAQVRHAFQDEPTHLVFGAR